VATETLTPSQVATRIFDALAVKDLEGALAFDDDSTVDDFVAVGRFKGLTEIRRFFEELLAAFPDFTLRVDRVVGDDTAAVVQWQAEGTFSGASFQGVEPTGRPVVIRGVDVMEIEEGVLRHNTIYYDGAGFARQIGLLPPAGSTLDKTVLSAFNTVTHLRQRISSRD
jgi:steroid delta-isomerase-like uncharacterized protein